MYHVTSHTRGSHGNPIAASNHEAIRLIGYMISGCEWCLLYLIYFFGLKEKHIYFVSVMPVGNAFSAPSIPLL